MRKYIIYEKSTGKSRWSELMSEEDVVQTPDEYILFKNKEDFVQWKSQIETVPSSPVTPVATVLKEKDNLLKETEDIIGSIEDISGETNSAATTTQSNHSVKHFNHGGKRLGSGRPKGPKSQAEKDKISQSMKGKKNASKASPP